ncbi:hypothetical protein [Porticoccus sp.]
MDDTVIHTERRKGLPALPSSYQLEKYLYLAQLLTVHQMENFGWDLAIVRRNGRPRPLALLKSYSQNKWMAIEADGVVVENPDISIR